MGNAQARGLRIRVPRTERKSNVHYDRLLLKMPDKLKGIRNEIVAKLYETISSGAVG